MCRDCRGCRLAGPASVCRSAGPACRSAGLPVWLRSAGRPTAPPTSRRPQVVREAPPASPVPPREPAVGRDRPRRTAGHHRRSPFPARVAAAKEKMPATAETVRPRADNGIHRAVTRHAAGSPTKTGTAEATCRAPVRLSELALRSDYRLSGPWGRSPRRRNRNRPPLSGSARGPQTAADGLCRPRAGAQPGNRHQRRGPGRSPRARCNPSAAHAVRMPVIQKLAVWIHPVAPRARALTGSRRGS